MRELAPAATQTDINSEIFISAKEARTKALQQHNDDDYQYFSSLPNDEPVVYGGEHHGFTELHFLVQQKNHTELKKYFVKETHYPNITTSNLHPIKLAIQNVDAFAAVFLIFNARIDQVIELFRRVWETPDLHALIIPLIKKQFSSQHLILILVYALRIDDLQLTQAVLDCHRIRDKLFSFYSGYYSHHMRQSIEGSSLHETEAFLRNETLQNPSKNYFINFLLSNTSLNQRRQNERVYDWLIQLLLNSHQVAALKSILNQHSTLKKSLIRKHYDPKRATQVFPSNHAKTLTDAFGEAYTKKLIKSMEAKMHIEELVSDITKQKDRYIFRNPNAASLYSMLIERLQTMKLYDPTTSYDSPRYEMKICCNEITEWRDKDSVLISNHKRYSVTDMLNVTYLQSFFSGNRHRLFIVDLLQKCVRFENAEEEQSVTTAYPPTL